MRFRCGILFSPPYGHGPADPDGCRLAPGHTGPHEFLEESGTVVQWETDWSCTCAHCRSEEGDWCTVYWRPSPAAPAESKAAA